MRLSVRFQQLRNTPGDVSNRPSGAHQAICGCWPPNPPAELGCASTNPDENWPIALSLSQLLPSICALSA